jgi:hypothetical protein
MSKSNNNSTKSGSRPGGRQNSQTKGNGKTIKNSSNRQQGKSFQQDMRSNIAPVARSMTVKTSKASVRSLSNGDCRVVHREYIRDITGTAAFFNTASVLNPGQVSVFPWLSRMARNFESYRFDKLHFLYETESATSEAGSVIMAIDYDASDSNASSKQMMMAYRGSVRTAPWSACKHISMKEDLSKLKSHFIRTGNLPAGVDVKLYDIGTLQVATSGTSTNTLGELYVEYDVTLMTPQFDQEIQAVGGSFAAGGTISAANPMGSVPVSDPQNVGVTLNSGSQLQFQQLGTYSISWSFVGTVITVAPATLTLGTGVTQIGATRSVIDGGALNAMIVVDVLVSDVNSPNNVVDLTLTATTVTSGRLEVAACPNGSLS